MVKRLCTIRADFGSSNKIIWIHSTVSLFCQVQKYRHKYLLPGIQQTGNNHIVREGCPHNMVFFYTFFFFTVHIMTISVVPKLFRRPILTCTRSSAPDPE